MKTKKKLTYNTPLESPFNITLSDDLHEIVSE